MAAASVVEFLSTISDDPTVKPEDIQYWRQHKIPNEAQTNFYGLIIGINEYISTRINNLKGAVADANAIFNYLVDNLKVPQNQIKTLYNKEATRENIIRAFQDLAVDDRIQNQDPIIIFYAGHGGQLDPPTGWETGGRRIQSIIPHDESAIYDSKNPVPSIPDYTLAALLDNISREKGDNVTVIFDCCHSTSGTRIEDRLPRVVESKNLVALSLDVDKDILPATYTSSAGRGSSVPKGLQSTGSRSHVLLAACGAEESAWETSDARGAFTVALLNALSGVNVGLMTYTGLLARLPALPSQMPQCEGEHRGRILFNSRVLGANDQFIEVVQTNFKYVLHAGAAQGIAAGAQFDLHRNNILGSHNPPIARFTIRGVGPFKSTLVPVDLKAERPTGTLFARQALEGNNYELSVFFTPALVQTMYNDQAGWKTVFNSNSEHPAFRFAETDQSAELVVDIQGDKAVFEVRNQIINSNGLVRLPESVPAKSEFILPVLRAAAKWNWHVNRTNPKDPFKGKVRIEMTRLKRPAPYARTTVPVGDNLNGNGVVDLVLKPGDIYGFKLVNESPYDLHPYLFYFDASDQSIECYYSGPQGGVQGSDPQLPGTGKDGTRPRGELTLGYGPGGIEGLTMEMSKGQENGVVIFKLFVTTSPTNFDSLNQASPFSSAGRKLVTMAHHAADQAALWGTAMMVVAQRTTPKPSAATSAA